MLIIYDVIIEIEAACLLESEVLIGTPLSNGYSYTRDGTIPFLYEFTCIMIFMRQSNTYLDISCQEKKRKRDFNFNGFSTKQYNVNLIFISWLKWWKRQFHRSSCRWKWVEKCILTCFTFVYFVHHFCTFLF